MRQVKEFCDAYRSESNIMECGHLKYSGYATIHPDLTMTFHCHECEARNEPSS